MAEPPDSRVTALLRAWQNGDPRAGEELGPLVYAELHRMARAKLRGERAGHTLQPTALVHEAWLRLMQQERADWRNRAQFFAIAAQAMRRILVDSARRRQAFKRGAGADHRPLDDAIPSPLPDGRLIALDAALDRLAVLDPRQARVVELRFFGGITVEDAAQTLGVSPTTIKREWASARAWLFKEIDGEHG
jgi:RNA polymerase sigma factor (TIGR02999 family)